MPKEAKKTVVNRVGEADPILSMGQRAYELVTAQWPSIVAFFATGGGVTLLAYLTDWARELGPLGIGLIVLVASITALISVALFLSLIAKRSLRQAQAESVRRWNREPSTANPLSPEYHTQRLSIKDLSSPIDNRIKNKRFIDCELIGPSVIVFLGNSVLTNCSFIDCDFAVIKEGAFIRNVTIFEDITAIGGVFWRCTIFMPKDMLEKFGLKVEVITLTGDPHYDNQ